MPTYSRHIKIGLARRATSQRHATGSSDRDLEYNTPPLGDTSPYPIFFRAGAALPTGTSVAYVQKIRAAGGFKRYEQSHLNALVASFAPKLSHVLPPELVRRVIEYAFHVGDY